ncbi:hypothetical protein M0R88_12275 [Halorussus gelatinilyticus]|uniref:Uncharacterized protein n=1 Tax=Halorussus gelatinilyticus TaxID=2937524 RepID=A0A8U0IGV5_9EURY|nr:hypothetical protein [Halorussus gelatinilyticus]UPV99298.1 hypothetical protein M0R88_12275 [Halorussus gelatinilyticus]
MSDESLSITVDLSDEDEEWVRYARNRKRPASEIDSDDRTLEADTRRKLRQAVYDYLEALDNDILDVDKRFALHDEQLLGELASLVVRRARNVEAIRESVRERLRSDEDVSAFDLPERTREATAAYLVEEAVGKAEIRSLADLLLEKERAVLDTNEFDTDTPRTETSWVSDRVWTRRRDEPVAENRTRLNSRG